MGIPQLLPQLIMYKIRLMNCQPQTTRKAKLDFNCSSRFVEAFTPCHVFFFKCVTLETCEEQP